MIGTLETNEFSAPSVVSFPISLKGKRWQLRETSPRDVLTLQQKFDLPEVVARMLCLRGVTLEQVEQYLTPSLKNSLPDPSEFLDMDKAAEYLTQAVQENKRITIFGDYDVDGATSAALLIRFFRKLGLETDYYIPDRMKEGYGPNPQAMRAIKDRGTDIVITVDCGSVAFEALEEAEAIGLEVIVVDHHLGGDRQPPCIAHINPNRLDETTEHRYLAAVGVSFLLAVAVNRALRQAGYFSGKPGLTNGVELLPLLDIAALGTVCDVMQLVGLNRAFVAQGLKVMQQRQNVGLRMLAETAGITSRLNVYHLGFLLGPRINAGGRIGKSDLGTRLLTTEDEGEARSIAEELDALNKERQLIETTALEQATELVERTQANASFILVADQDAKARWHPGIIGIVAGRLKEAFDKPVAVISTEEVEGKLVGKGSVRSIPGVDVGSLIGRAKQEGLLLGGGGHAAAAGFSIAMERSADFATFLHEYCAEAVTAYANDRVWKADLCLPLSAVTPELLDTLDALAPYGMGNPEPRMIVSDARMVDVRIVGKNHISAIFMQDAGAFSGGRLKAVAFRADGTAFGEELKGAKGKTLALAGRAKRNEWQGRISAEFHIEDAVIVS